MALQIKRAKKRETFMFAGLQGPTNSGKTGSMLRMLMRLAERLNGQFGVIDTERGRASKFIGFQFADGARVPEFDVIELETYSPEIYTEAVKEFLSKGYVALGIDSLSHEWMGPGGVLEIVNSYEGQKGGKFQSGWGNATPRHNAFWHFLMSSRIHKVCTMRSEMKYEIDPETKKVRILGLEAVQRTGKNDVSYEFDFLGDISKDHILTPLKVPPSSVFNDLRMKFPGADLADLLLNWLQADAVTLEQQINDAKVEKAKRIESLKTEIVTLGQQIQTHLPDKEWWEKKGKPFFEAKGDDEEKLIGCRETFQKRLNEVKPVDVTAALEQLDAAK